ncbi:alanine/glycine:cation symporter family protein [Clostridium sp. FAM 1755]|uniref:Sodium:alanine symporter family protein n=1 Tax=Clostridium botulinum TaxID=1491 RepID=A0A6M0T265_CLOBO|nr:MULTISPECIES: sodium:alanine symporter family protein [Clostridium]EJP6472915.1 sodium:alanine symporter family protein [Clostridium botulinum]KOR24336.1 alanine glycine permease [Clostridium sp. L74]NFA61866.1 sodium:alanine symporter family protein [Clostridium botulinum]NFI73875.1 sodium:alanine symporter family protein [Clostridium sporogenes]NFL71687.1 sodium:alanine symporter family protein [Clostridium sporogenes]
MDLLNAVKSINNVLWNYVLIFLLCGTGILFTVSLKFVQVSKFKESFKKAFGGMSLKGKKAGSDGMSSFQSLATAVAAQVGTGNLAGAATAIVSGGPGAIFWMWISAFLGMATIFGEAVLAQVFKEKVNGEVTGGPAYYISKGLKSKFLASFFSISIILALGFIGNMVQANSIGVAFSNIFNIPSWIIGIIVAILGLIVFIGGIGRIASVTEKMVPIMALFYIIGSIIILVSNYTNILPSFKLIFVSAFNPKAAIGGVAGVTVKQAIRYGVARGLFSNEAGMGSTPHAHAVAKVKHPVEQGLVAIVGVFIDTFIVLTFTALVILATGVLDGKTTGIELTQNAFIKGLGNFGGYFIAIALFFFAFSTIIGWYFFGEANVKYLFKGKGLNIYRILVGIFIVAGTTLKVDLVWELADTFNGLMVIPNVIALIALVKIVKESLKDYNENFEVKDI